MERIDSGRDERKAENRVCSLKQRQPDDCANDIEAQMHDGCAPRVLVRADGGQHGRHARADVLSHDNGDRRAVADSPGRGQRLQNTDRRGRGLHNARQNRARQNAQNGIREQQEEFREVRVVPQPGDGAGQRFHAEHQRREAKKDQARVLFLALCSQIQHNADHSQHRRERRRLQQLHEQAVPADAGQRQQPRCHSRADIRAHDNRNGLLEAQKPRIDKAHDHDRRSRGRLNDRRNGKPRQKPGKFPVRQLRQNGLQGPARALFQRRAHHTHAEQEQTQRAEQC